MNVRKTGVAILAAVAVAAAAGIGAALTGSTSPAVASREATGDVAVANTAPPAWLRAEMIRGEALNDLNAWLRADMMRGEKLNELYAWLRADMIRGEALNDEYAWLRALLLRSEELNRIYGLGEYAPAE